ncbi:zinc finger protein 644-like protein [Lates japonicus]|uniref:Zinc finger protein 644-like protein n=1 Tax=Lates japonicus TaxID=270547 RepID=A0AAD3MCG6_LATJO|nr:zinc finger protein 644-like protein [Lates japonicus]
MAQESASCTDSFSKPSVKQNSVLDVLSNEDMLSPVGLGNGPSSHQATQAHELNSISTEKEEEKSITPLKTVQEIDTAGIWGFDEDSPENSLDNYSSTSDLHWDPHKEFMQFLWENHGDSPGEEPKEEVPPTNNQRRRKRKMDMVVMVDPSEDLYPDLSHKSSEELSDAEEPEDSMTMRKVRKSRKFPKSQSSPTGNVSKGHLHRVGLSYNARHVVSPEQVASQDRRPRIRRKISAFRRLKKALQVESDSDTVRSIHSCPLCGDSFDNRTGQSNHIRGHLKKLGTTALIGILKRRKCQEDARLKGSSQMSRNTLTVSSNSEHSSGSRVAASLPNSISEKGEFNRKVCVHCNATFHSGVSLSNHLRAYAKRKRTALLEGTTFDCKARRQRSRPGSKKKTLPLPQTPEEMYRLTCRFCDLVFQGPLSVQEDWIKHLQRHIMNTSVPHTGLGMVEVTSLPTDPPTLKTDQDSSLTATHAAS